MTWVTGGEKTLLSEMARLLPKGLPEGTLLKPRLDAIIVHIRREVEFRDSVSFSVEKCICCLCRCLSLCRARRAQRTPTASPKMIMARNTTMNGSISSSF